MGLGVRGIELLQPLWPYLPNLSMRRLMEMGSRSSVRFKINNDLFGERHTDLASDHKDPNPATLVLMQKRIYKHKGIIPESISKACQSI